MPIKPPKRTKEEVIVAIQRGYTITSAAAILGVERVTLRGYIRRWQEVRDALAAKREEIADNAELALRLAVTQGQPWAIMFALRTLRKEIFSERTEVTGERGEPIRIIEVERAYPRLLPAPRHDDTEVR